MVNKISRVEDNKEGEIKFLTPFKCKGNRGA